jgi:hypothetical protein
MRLSADPAIKKSQEFGKMRQNRPDAIFEKWLIPTRNPQKVVGGGVLKMFMWMTTDKSS